MSLKRNIQVIIRVTENEFFKLRRLARMAGLSVAAFFRLRCLDDRKIIVNDADAMRDLYNEIHAIGVNVNQVARVANSTGYVPKEKLLLLQEYMVQIKELLSQKLKGV